MATKSILKNIIVDKSMGRSLASALEESKKSSKSIDAYQQAPNCIEKKDIKKFFGLGDK